MSVIRQILDEGVVVSDGCHCRQPRGTGEQMPEQCQSWRIQMDLVGPVRIAILGWKGEKRVTGGV